MIRSELESTVYNLLKENGITTRIFKQDTRDPNYKGNISKSYRLCLVKQAYWQILS